MYTSQKKIALSKVFIHLFFIIACVFCVIPVIIVASISFSDEMDILKNGYSLWPRIFSTKAYEIIFRNPKQIVDAYKVTIFVTVVGTLLSLFVTSTFAYTLSRRDYRYRRVLSFYVFFTMLFNGGLVPFYMLVTRVLHMKDTIWALIIPYTCNAWNMLLMRTYFQKIPRSLIESAKIDGASEFRIYFTIIVPLSKPAMATIGLFIMLQYWNDWWLSLLFANRSTLFSLQLLLTNILQNIEFITSTMEGLTVDVGVKNIPTEGVRMAMCMLAMGPILFVFPFFQKYFVKGLTIGAIKG